MKEEIKEKLLKEKNEIEDDGCGEICGDRGEYTCLGKGIYLCMLCRERLIELEAQLQQHEETSKAKDEEFIKILEELQDLILKDGFYKIGTEKHLTGLVDVRKVFNHFVEIKQRIKENEE